MQTIEVGKIVNTHGLRGEVKIVHWCDYPEVFEQFTKIYLDDTAYKVVNIRYHKQSVILKLDGVDTIEEAESLKNHIVTASRDDFNLPDGKYFIADIIGLNVISDAINIGVISDVIQTGANDVYVIKRPKLKDLLFPATPETVNEVNIEGGYVSVNIPEGLDEI